MANFKINGYCFSSKFVASLTSYEQFEAAYIGSAYTGRANQKQLLKDAWDAWNLAHPKPAAPIEKPAVKGKK